MPPNHDSWTEALKRVRHDEEEYGKASEEDIKIIENAMDALWSRIVATPEYVMTQAEFPLFNYFRNTRYSTGASAEIAQRSAKKFWDKYRSNA